MKNKNYVISYLESKQSIFLPSFRRHSSKWSQNLCVPDNAHYNASFKKSALVRVKHDFYYKTEFGSYLNSSNSSLHLKNSSQTIESSHTKEKYITKSPGPILWATSQHTPRFQKKKRHLWKTTPLTIHLLTIPPSTNPPAPWFLPPEAKLLEAEAPPTLPPVLEWSSRPVQPLQIPPRQMVENHHISLHYLKCHFFFGGKGYLWCVICSWKAVSRGYVKQNDC